MNEDGTFHDFRSFGLNSSLIQGINELGIIKPTEIQALVIPALMSGHCDLVGQAQTGTGKTAAYGLPLLSKVDANKKVVQGLILCPTRELAMQVDKQLFKFTKYSEKVFSEAVYGGAHIDRQITALRRPTQIIVATPGRLIDLLERKAVDLSNVHTVILDEADEMLSMGFKAELDQILTRLSSARSKWLFSATMPRDIQRMVDQHLATDAHRISVSGKNVVNRNISHRFFICEEEEKLTVLLQFLKTQGDERGLVFCKTKAATDKLGKQLLAKNIAAVALHGDLQQRERDKVMRAFKNRSAQILVATDLAARGIDIEGLSYVAHYQLPDKEAYYTHRSGRTARAGKEGVSLCIVTRQEVRQLRYFEKALKISFDQVR